MDFKGRSKKQMVKNKDDAHTSAELSISPSQQVLLNATNHMVINTICYPSVSGFIPDFHNFFHCLKEVHEFLHFNHQLRRICPAYLSLSSTIYYAILLIFQISRARKSIGITSLTESQFVSEFERRFPLENLPIAGPLVQFFEGLGVVSTDERYGPVCTDIIDLSTFNENGSFAAATCGKSRFPLIPMLIQLWHDIRSNNDIRDNPQDLLFWKPGVTKLGIDFNIPFQYSEVASSPAWYEPLANLVDSCDYDTLRTRLRRLPAPPDMNTISYSSIGNFCGLSDNTDWSWFNQFKHIAKHEASLFKGLTFMSTISTKGGLNLLVETQSTIQIPSRNYTVESYINEPFYSIEKLPSGNPITCFSRLGNETDIRLGFVTAFCLRYRGMSSNNFFRKSHGPWFNKNSDAFDSKEYPKLNTSKPFTHESCCSYNPAMRFFDVITKMYM